MKQVLTFLILLVNAIMVAGQFNHCNTNLPVVPAEVDVSGSDPLLEHFGGQSLC